MQATHLSHAVYGMQSRVDTIHEKRTFTELYDRYEALKLRTMSLNRKSWELDNLRDKDLSQQTKYLEASRKDL